MNTISKSVTELFALRRRGIKLGLDNVRAFLKHLGNPQEELTLIQVAGSNGKGSTASFITSILMEAGMKTGLNTSPHYVSFSERIKINGAEIDDDFIAHFVDAYMPYIKRHGVTFFESVTALAFLYFKHHKVDIAVMETGLGGRLDATNVHRNIAAVITSISLEHTAILGDTIAAIAGEKAHIIKEGSKAFIGELPEEAEMVINNRCSDLKCDLLKIKPYICSVGNDFSFTKDNLQFPLHSPLPGYHQQINAALAALTVKESFSITDPEIYIKGINAVRQNVGVQGRFEFLAHNPDVLIDSAHNPESLSRFLEEFQKIKYKYSKLILLFSALSDKNHKAMFRLLAPHFDEIFVAPIDSDRAAPVDMLFELAAGVHKKVKKLNELEKGLDVLSAQKEDVCFVVLGSIFLLGEWKQIFSAHTNQIQM